MNITTKFDIGDIVYPLECYRKVVNTTCVDCGATGMIQLSDKDYECPVCQGYKVVRQVEEKKWHFEKEKVGKVVSIVVMLFDENSPGNSENSVKCMVGTALPSPGSRFKFNEDDLFYSEKEALEECTRRNKGLMGSSENVGGL